MQQYRDIKARHPRTILFFRMGDFYEMFEDDAKLAARELGLTLTSRNNGGAAEVPLAGVPVKAATEYLRRLIAKGFSVAICEQIEDPKLAKGVVRRAVVETVTPGTILADDWLVQSRNNYIVAVDARTASVGIAALDITTGELVLEVVPAEDLESALARHEPREIVVPVGDASRLPASTRTEREAWEFASDLAREDLARIYSLASLDGLGICPEDEAAPAGCRTFRVL
jgi:DNA mismatch repair protein MutS